MVDEPAGGHRSGSIEVEPRVVDVPLIGSESLGDDRPPDDPSPTNWRRAIGIALVAGTVIGIGASVVRLATEDDAATTSTLPTDELATVITTPPTLTPLETLPPPDVDRSTPSDISEPPPVERPVYEEVTLADGTELVRYDIAEAVDLLGRDVARRSETHLELGYQGFALDVSIERDPVLDRYEIILESPTDTQVAIVDIPTGTTYINPGTDNRVEVLNADIIAGSTTTDVNEYFDRLLLGPFRPETYDPASTLGRGLVTIDEVGTARQFLTTIAGELIPEWQLYAFGPVYEFQESDRPSALEYAVYVTADGRIARIDGVSYAGTVPQLVQHRLTELDETTPIDIPPQATQGSTAPVPTSAEPTTPGTEP